jgi:hypothetical protein
MNTPKYNRFKKQSGVYTCVDCGKQTRETGAGESTFELCRNCLNRAELSNEHSDKGHDTPVKNCPDCEVELERNLQVS